MTSFHSNYERLDERRCWYCSTDDQTFGGFQLYSGRLTCHGCAQRAQAGEFSYMRAFTLFRAMKGTPHQPLKGLIRRKVYTYYDIKYYKSDRNDRARASDCEQKLIKMGAALTEVVHSLAAEESLDPRRTVLIPVPNFDVTENHVLEIAKRVTSDLRLRDVLKCIKDVKAKYLSREARWRERLDAYTCPVDLTSKAVILADDLFTSGSTLNGASAACRAAGSRAVFGVTVARLIEPELQEEYLDGLTPRRRHWWPLGNGSIVAPKEPSQAIRLRFNCRECPNRVQATLGWPIAAAEFECSECSTPYRFSATRGLSGLYAIDVAGCRRADLTVSFD